jgi:hypothetical protein
MLAVAAKSGEWPWPGSPPLSHRLLPTQRGQACMAAHPPNIFVLTTEARGLPRHGSSHQPSHIHLRHLFSWLTPPPPPGPCPPAGKPERMLEMYAPNAVLLPTVADGPMDTPAKIKA